LSSTRPHTLPTPLHTPLPQDADSLNLDVRKAASDRGKVDLKAGADSSSGSSAKKRKATPTKTAKKTSKTALNVPGSADREVAAYLARYGYLLDQGEVEEASAKERILLMQKFLGVDTTGDLDAATLQAMRLPRCANIDVVPLASQPLALHDTESDSSSSQQSSQQSGKWRKRKLTWRVTKYSDQGMPEELVHLSLRRAFAVWEEFADLTFIMVETGVPDLEIRWERGDHGDGGPFDGGGGTLAHGFFPAQGRISGDIHFDDDETWTLGTNEGVNLTQAAAHETGHSLGLDHSTASRALMAPHYRGYKAHFQLHEDDITKIQSLYGKATGRPEEPPREPVWVPGRRRRRAGSRR
jgi:matrix metalloproteinase-14 (membrane-inserted)